MMIFFFSKLTGGRPRKMIKQSPIFRPSLGDGRLLEHGCL